MVISDHYAAGMFGILRMIVNFDADQSEGSLFDSLCLVIVYLINCSKHFLVLLRSRWDWLTSIPPSINMPQPKIYEPGLLNAIANQVTSLTNSEVSTEKAEREMDTT